MGECGGRPVRLHHWQRQRRSPNPRANLSAVIDADWERLCRLINLPPEAREDLETIITTYQRNRRGAPPIPSKLKSSLKNVAEDARRLATSLGELSGRAQLIINLVREKQTVEHLWLLEAVAGTGEFRPFDPGLNSEEFISSKGSGFLSEILERVTRLEEYAASAAAANRDWRAKRSALLYSFLRSTCF